jgi:hypothetical protein
MMRKARTQIINKHEVDILVQEFSCTDDATFQALGNHSKETRWKIQAGINTQPYEIKLHVDKTLAGSPEIWVECQGAKVFPESGKKQSKLREDFIWHTTFRGTIRGINEKHRFEAMPPILDRRGEQSWYPAVITRQRPDGTLDVDVEMTDQYGKWQIVPFSGLRPENLREQHNKKRLEIPMRLLLLEVPKSDPLHATLKTSAEAVSPKTGSTASDEELVTHYFARQTPPPGKATTLNQSVKFKVNKERTQIQGSIGAAELDQLLKAEAFVVRQEAHKRKRTWEVQIGPFAKHTILLERKHMTGKLLSLTVDDVPFVESAPSDIDCDDAWECKFRFKGEKYLTFEVFETNRDGAALDSTRPVTKVIPYVIECEVRAPDSGDLKDATFLVNGFKFEQLPVVPTQYQEEKINMTTQAFTMTFEEPVPFAINYDAAHGLGAAFSTAAGTASAVLAGARPGPGGFGGFLFSCCLSADGVESSTTNGVDGVKYSNVIEQKNIAARPDR